MYATSLQATIAIIVLVAILLTIVYIAWRTQPPGKDLQKVIDDTLERLAREARHHVEVNAVLALTETFRDKPDLLRNLAGYSRQVVGAALVQRVNELGQQLKTANQQLTTMRRRQGEYGSAYDDDVARIGGIVTEISEELGAANSMAEAFAVQT